MTRVGLSRAAPSRRGESRQLSEPKRVATELDERVAQRTRELERALKRSEALLAEAQRLSSTGSFTWCVESGELTWSPQSYRIFQIDRATPVTLALIDERVHPEDLTAFHGLLARARSEGSELKCDFRLRLPDGAIRYVQVVAHSSRDDNGRLEYTGAVQDVTERRLSEEALCQLRSELAHVAGVTTLDALTAFELSRATFDHEVEIGAILHDFASLTPREREVMALVVSGLLNKQVGSKLGISEVTVKAHRGRVMRKMDARSLADLVTMAARLHVVA